MIFRLIRYCLLLILLVSSVWGILRRPVKRKKLAIVLAAAISVIIVSLSSVFPVENLFVRFQDPESAFHYVNGNPVRRTLDGNSSCMVIYRTGKNSGSFLLIPKSEQGYTLPTPFFSKKVLDRLDENGAVEVYQVKGCADYYLFASIPTSEDIDEIEFFSESGVKDATISYELEKSSGFLYVYAYFNKSPLGYSLLVAEKTIVI